MNSKFLVNSEYFFSAHYFFNPLFTHYLLSYDLPMFYPIFTLHIYHIFTLYLPGGKSFICISSEFNGVPA